MATIFLSYRRDDTAGIAGRIYDRLQTRFGPGTVFMDVDGIPSGVDFREHIDGALNSCRVVLAVIGPRWAGELPGAGRRLDDPRDSVRIELETALGRKLPVIPVLIGHRVMPGEAELPSSLAPLAFRNASHVDQDRDFDHHVDRLIQDIKYHLERPVPKPPEPIISKPPEPDPLSFRMAMVLSGATLLVALLVVSVALNPRLYRGHVTPKPDVTAPGGVATGTKEQGTKVSHVEPKTPAAPDPPKQFRNALDMTLVRIEPGSFTMGTTDAQVESLLKLFSGTIRGFFEAEQPAHRVTITRPFYLGSHEVTVGQFRRFVEETGYKTDAEKQNEGNNWRRQGSLVSENFPVVCVSHNDAVAFCAWLNEQGKGTGWSYRLPTEAEWEYACRAGTVGLFGGSDDPAELDRVAWFLTRLGGGTHPVGLKEKNKFGLYDMLGNVSEWCGDYYDAAFYTSSPEVDPHNTQKPPFRVYRGGCWENAPRICRPASRDVGTPESWFITLGFRVAAVRQ
jgi:formylglycine-generating enzyme required for sulfatase activity